MTPVNFNVVNVTCPTGYEVVGGGVDVGNVLMNVVTSSSPTYGGSRLLFEATGSPVSSAICYASATRAMGGNAFWPSYAVVLVVRA